ncbi:hypothetical protein ACC695_40485, partial [Rhizobium ruizarguesonis]
VSRLDTRSPGYYLARVVIPAGLLNTGTFYLRAGISIRFSIYSVVEGIRFEVEDNVGISQGSWIAEIDGFRCWPSIWMI